MRYILGIYLKCEGLNESDIYRMALLGVKIRGVFHIDPGNAESQEEDGSFRHLQYMNFRTICTVFLI